MKTFYKQFWRNMLVGTGFALIWYYGLFIWIKSFWISTILTNLIGFVLGRYWIYREGVK